MLKKSCTRRRGIVSEVLWAA